MKTWRTNFERLIWDHKEIYGVGKHVAPPSWQIWGEKTCKLLHQCPYEEMLCWHKVDEASNYRQQLGLGACYSDKFGHRSKCILKIQTFLLSISLYHKSSFKMLNDIVNVVFDFTNPFVSYGFLAWGRCWSVHVFLASKGRISTSMALCQGASLTTWENQVGSSWCEMAERNVMCFS